MYLHGMLQAESVSPVFPAMLESKTDIFALWPKALISSELAKIFFHYYQSSIFNNLVFKLLGQFEVCCLFVCLF